MAEEEVERIFVIPLKKRGFKSSQAADTAMKRVKNFLVQHMKVEQDNIWIDDSLNHAVWKRGKYKMPHQLRVKAVKFEDGVVEAYIPELEFKKSRRELLKEEREKKAPILRREEAEMEEEPGEIPGAEGYDIAPTADGEVKIKKKKSSKPKEEKKEKKEETKKPSEKQKKEKTEKKPKDKPVEKPSQSKKKRGRPKGKQKATKEKEEPREKPRKETKEEKKKKEKPETTGGAPSSDPDSFSEGDKSTK